MSAPSWDPKAPLEPGRTWLLEASAGTGKTFQIAGLVLRLVAEYGVPVHKILAITFTNAATAELRHRIRGRLDEALRALSRPPRDEEPDDVFLAYLRSLDDLERQRLRLELALRDFDLAPISTIHSFSQRTLQELAFESGQDLSLELLSSTSPLEERLVDDALARLYAQTNEEELAWYRRWKFTRKNLLATAKALSGATRHPVQPSAEHEPTFGLAALRAHRARLLALAERLEGPEFEALCGDAHHLGKLTADKLLTYRGTLVAWLRGDADLETLREQRGKARNNAFKVLCGAWFRSSWNDIGSIGRQKTGPYPLAERPWWPLVASVDEAVSAVEAFESSWSPVAGFACTVRDELERELERRRWLTFNGMLSRLAETIAEPGAHGDALAVRLRERYDAVFVDEFQDTDAAQWVVLQRAFHGHARLFLIGDPKQAIYAFRGADVNVYLDAARSVIEPDGAPSGGSRTMTVNYRSDHAAVAAMNALWRPSSKAFDVDGIDYVAVSADKGDRLAPGGVGLEVRWLDARVVGGAPGEPVASAKNRLVASLAADEVVAWLNGEHGTIDGRRPVPGDFGVLVPRHAEAAEVKRALVQRGVPAVVAAKRSVFDTRAAEWIRDWLDAVNAGGRDRAARRAAVTPLVGWTADRLAWLLAQADGEVGAPSSQPSPGEDRSLENDVVPTWNAWTERLRAASDRWSKAGFARTFDRELTELVAMPRVLALPEGERHATDLRHLLELLHVEERTRRLGPGALADWLGSQRSADADSKEQRLESDADAVRVETVHVSKGLEYPVVLLPFAWRAHPLTDKPFEPLAVRRDGETVVDLHPPAHPERASAERARKDATRQEQLRQLYVALTRAKHRTIAWWGPVGKEAADTSSTPFGRLLMRGPDEVGFGATVHGDFKADAATAYARVHERLGELAASSGGSIGWTAVEKPIGASRFRRPAEEAVRPVAWPNERVAPSFSRRWTVTSFSRLAKGAAVHDRDEKLRPDELATRDLEGSPREPSGEVPSAAVVASKPPEVLPLELPAQLRSGGGTVFGTFVHEVFETLDFASLDGSATTGERARSAHAALPALVARIGARHGFAATSREVTEVTDRIPDWLATPLDAQGGTSSVVGLPPGFALRHLARADRQDELEFDLRLGQGSGYVRSRAKDDEGLRPLDARVGCVDPRAVYAAIRREKPSRALEAWLAQQAVREAEGEPLIGSIAGMLTGSIDLAFRVRGATSDRVDDRYFVVDYKTNKVETNAPGHFTGPWLDWKMATSGYVLQSLIYTLALHRHLTVRLGSHYDYERNVGGALYLFLRGMGGATTPRCARSGQRLGVHGHRWSFEVIDALDRALDAAPIGGLVGGEAASMRAPRGEDAR